MGTTPYKPWAQSVTGGGFSLGEKYLPKRLLPVHLASSLAELAGEYAFFTPAVLYLHGQMTDEPLGDFRHTFGYPVDFFHFRFPHPLFRGLTAPCGDPDWNHVLWAVERHAWPAFRDFYLSIVLLDPVARTASQVAYTELEVGDSLALVNGKVGRRPTVPVTAFGIDGSAAQLAFKPSADPVLFPPRLLKLPPTPKMVQLAQAYAGAKGTKP